MKSTGQTKRPAWIYGVLLLALACSSYFLVFSSHAQAGKPSILRVTNLNDGGAGSLRQALDDANTRPGQDTIKFSISGTILIPGNLDFRDQSGVVLDGFSAPDPGVILRITNGGAGLMVVSSNNVIRGLTIVGADWDCWGITMNWCVNSAVENNTIDTNRITNCGRAICVCQAKKNMIRNNVLVGNNIGVHLTSEMPPPVDENIIEDNVIGNNNVGILMDQGFGNIIRGNYVGLDRAGNGLPNTRGIAIASPHTSPVPLTGNNTVGPGNVIAFNTEYGIVVHAPVYMPGITFTKNSVFDHLGLGLVLPYSEVNGYLPPPTILNTNPIAGAAPPDSTVEMFLDGGNEGRFFIGSVKADHAGNFTSAYSLIGLTGNVTATATDQYGNTSEFSFPVSIL